MKKRTSFLTIAILFVMALVVPLLAGCAKTCTVDISIVGGNGNGGWIFSKNYLSAYGKSTIEEGQKYSVYIAPSDGYKIGEIKVNGEKYTNAVNVAGHDFQLVIEGDTNIEVSFEKYSYNFKIYYATGGSNTFAGWVEYTGHTFGGKHGERILLANGAEDVLNPLNFSEDIKDVYDEYGGLFFVEHAGVKTFVDHGVGFVVKNGGYQFKTYLSQEQLDVLFAPRHTVSVEDATEYAAGDANAPYGTIKVNGADLSEKTDYTVMEGKSLALQIDANAGYVIEKVVIGEVEYYVNDNRVDLPHIHTVTKSDSIKVYFKAETPVPGTGA